MLLEMYGALKDAGTSEEKARSAATAMLPREQMATKEDVWRLEAKIDRSQISMSKWFTGIMIAQDAGIVALVKLLP